MDRPTANETPKLEVAAAKAHLRQAADQVQPGRDLLRTIRLSPWASVGVALALGVLLGVVPGSRRNLPALAGTLLRRLG